ncbi:MAG TPA: bifunctional adenosylcobinamide kinase/adenosylcobinamide-phosphate guanylyltransferase [Acidimicrobiales bacterium]|nr:bifunctional adenosylcobinamide kinase/adenosylcobinamide-phosphate guanylyltransferase [Acidimicrobiales bacterium]
MIVLVLGGARSGKSEVAERMAARLPQPVTYVATAVLGKGAGPERVGPVAAESEPVAGDLAARVAAHRARRPAAWATVELPLGADLADATRRLTGTLLVDSLGVWLAGRENLDSDGGRLCRELVARAGDTVVVSDEVGLGVHPSTAAGLAFRDALGELNRRLSEVADDAVLVVAGRVLRLVAGEPEAGAEAGVGAEAGGA